MALDLRLGAMYPVVDLGCGPGEVREWAVAAEEMGYADLWYSEHVLGADLSVRPDWRPMLGNPPRYTHKDPFGEPFTLFGFLAAHTKKVTLGTNITVMGMRQTALFAKQAALVDVLTGGRLLLGTGSGWSDVEYEAMGVDWKSRGRRIEEQIEVARKLWTEEVVTYEGKWHKINAAGLNPLPVQRPIPLWIGGGADVVIKRAGRLADGFLPALGGPGETTARKLDMMREAAREAGRDPDTIEIGVSVAFAGSTVDGMLDLAGKWRDLGATRLIVRSVGGGFKDVGEHIEAIRRFIEAARN